MNKFNVYLSLAATFIAILSAFAFLVWHLSVYVNKLEVLQYSVQQDSALLQEHDMKLTEIELAELDCVKKFEYIVNQRH